MEPFGNLDSALQSCQLLKWVEPAAGWDEQLRRKCSTSSILIVTGASGTGKSRVLRDLRSTHDLVEPSAPAATAIARTDTWRSLALREPNIAHWEQVWRCAIFGSLLTHLREHRDLLESDHRKRMKKLVRRFPEDLFGLGYARHPFGIIQVLAKTLHGATDPFKVGFFERSEWRDAEMYVRQVLHAARPVLLEFDSLDDYFDNDPSIVSEVQAGLVQFLAHLEREPLPRDKARIHASVSNSAYRFLRRHRGGDASQLPQLTEIAWSLSSLNEFAQQGIDSLGLAASETNMFAPLCESDRVFVPAREVRETIDRYVFRHTALVPRDIALIGNKLASRYTYLNRPLTEAEVRSEVRDAAAFLAGMRVSRMVSELMALGYRNVPDHVASQDGGVGQRTLDLQLRVLVNELGDERFERASLLKLVEVWDEPTRAFFLDSLWDSRLLAICPDASGVRRISRSVFDQLPPGALDLAFVPVLLDIYELQPSREEVLLEFI